MRIPGVSSMLLAVGLALASVPATAAVNAAAPKLDAPAAAAPAAATAAATPPAEAATPAAPVDPLLSEDGAPPAKSIPGTGEPVDGVVSMQGVVTPTGEEAQAFHNHILVPLITIISVLVLVLLLYVIVRYRRAANPNPSRTSHNTLIEILWTGIPVLILVAIAVPSIRLLAHQFKPAPDNAVTLKAIGNQWFWSYEYPDHGVQITANMLKEKDQVEPGQRARTDADGPRLLATDARVVLPVGVPIRLQTTSPDVIHSWAVPAFWIKLDAVPGKINETSFIIKKPGLYFGQCSELCGARHAFMPIAVQAVDPATFAAWVKAKGGKMPEVKAAAAVAAAPVPAADANASDISNEAEADNAAGNAE